MEEMSFQEHQMKHLIDYVLEERSKRPGVPINDLFLEWIEENAEDFRKFYDSKNK